MRFCFSCRQIESSMLSNRLGSVPIQWKSHVMEREQSAFWSAVVIVLHCTYGANRALHENIGIVMTPPHGDAYDRENPECP